jgi:hypothetical protein
MLLLLAWFLCILEKVSKETHPSEHYNFIYHQSYLSLQEAKRELSKGHVLRGEQI